MAKKKIIKDYEAGKAVPTQELVKAYEEEAATLEPTPGGFTAIATFDMGGQLYEIGAAFDPATHDLIHQSGNIFTDKTGRVIYLPVRE